MKKSVLFTITLSLLVVIFAIGASAANIGSAEDLLALMNDTFKWDGEYTLTADIDISGKTQCPIGTYERAFTGTFDGNGHTITVDLVAGECGGLFGVVEGATIKNLILKGRVECTFAATSAETKLEGGYSGTGGIVGVVLTGSTIENCTNYAEVIGPCNVGGVVGLLNNVGEATIDIVNCANYGKVNSTYGNLGGIMGRVRTETGTVPAATITGCANYADLHYVSEDRARFSGIIAYIRSNEGVIIVKNCRNEGNLEGVNNATSAANSQHVGAISGRVEIVGSTSAIQYTGCYNSGMISSTKYAAGMVAYISRADSCMATASYFENCVNVGALTGGTYAGGIVAYTNNSCMADTHSVVLNCLNTAPVVADGSAGGMIGRLAGFDIKDSVNLGTVEALNAGGLVGIADGQTFCEINNSFYPDSIAMATGLTSPFCMDVGSKSYPAGAANSSASFAGLDFADAWTMGKLCPVPKAMVAENIVVPTEKAPVLTPSVVETTAPETTAAPETTTAATAVTTAAPAVTTAAPAATTAAPAVTTAAPAVTTAAPAATTAAPAVTTAAPAVTTAAPAVTTAAPASTTAAPAKTTETPAVTTAAPKTTTAPETTAALAPTEDGGAPVGVIFGIIAVVIVVAAIAVVVIKKKKA